MEETEPVEASNESASIRRSTPECHLPGEWWNAPASLIENVLDINISVVQATKGEVEHLWTTATEFELGSLLKHKTWVVVSACQAKHVQST